MPRFLNSDLKQLCPIYSLLALFQNIGFSRFSLIRIYRFINQNFHDFIRLIYRSLLTFCAFLGLLNTFYFLELAKPYPYYYRFLVAGNATLEEGVSIGRSVGYAKFWTKQIYRLEK